MSFRVSLRLVLLLCYLQFTVGYEDESEDWVDPGDMISFDPVLKKNIRRSNTNKQRDVQKASDDGHNKKLLSDHNSNYAIPDTKQNIKNLPSGDLQPKHQLKSIDKKQTSERNEKDLIFMKRFIAFYTRKLEEVAPPHEEFTCDISVSVSKDTWNTFDQFNYNSNKLPLQEVLHQLEKTFVEFVPSKEYRERAWRWKFEDYFQITVNDACMIVFMLLMMCTILTLQIVSKISWRTQFIRLLGLMFCLSYGWTYVHHYRKAVAKHRASLTNVPDHCKDSSQERPLPDGIFSFLRHMFSTSKDPCTEYHESYLISPLITLSPFKVLAVTVSEFLLEPLNHMGTAFSRTFRNMFSELPVQLWVPAFIFILFIMIAFLLLLSVCFGYTWNFHLPFWTGFEIAPSHHATQVRHHEEITRNYRNQIESQQRQIDALQLEMTRNRGPAIGGIPNRDRGGSVLSPIWRFLGYEEAPDPSLHDAVPAEFDVAPNSVTDFPPSSPDDRSNLRRRCNLPYPPADSPYPPSDPPYPPNPPRYSPTDPINVGNPPTFFEATTSPQEGGSEPVQSPERFVEAVDRDPPTSDDETTPKTSAPTEIGFRRHIVSPVTRPSTSASSERSKKSPGKTKSPSRKKVQTTTEARDDGGDASRRETPAEAKRNPDAGGDRETENADQDFWIKTGEEATGVDTDADDMSLTSTSSFEEVED